MTKKHPSSKGQETSSSDCLESDLVPTTEMKLEPQYIASNSFWWRYLQLEWQTIHSTISHTLHLLLLFPYPTNTVKRPHMPLETSSLTAAIFIQHVTLSLCPLLPLCLQILINYVIMSLYFTANPFPVYFLPVSFLLI